LEPGKIRRKVAVHAHEPCQRETGGSPEGLAVE
jgi:hypothetical protein